MFSLVDGRLSDAEQRDDSLGHDGGVSWRGKKHDWPGRVMRADGLSTVPLAQSLVSPSLRLVSSSTLPNPPLACCLAGCLLFRRVPIAKDLAESQFRCRPSPSLFFFLCFCRAISSSCEPAAPLPLPPRSGDTASRVSGHCQQAGVSYSYHYI